MVLSRDTYYFCFGKVITRTYADIFLSCLIVLYCAYEDWVYCCFYHHTNASVVGIFMGIDNFSAKIIRTKIFSGTYSFCEMSITFDDGLATSYSLLEQLSA